MEQGEENNNFIKIKEMKKIFMLMLSCALFSCEKDETPTTPNSPGKCVIFSTNAQIGNWDIYKSKAPVLLGWEKIGIVKTCPGIPSCENFNTWTTLVENPGTYYLRFKNTDTDSISQIYSVSITSLGCSAFDFQ